MSLPPSCAGCNRYVSGKSIRSVVAHAVEPPSYRQPSFLSRLIPGCVSVPSTSSRRGKGTHSWTASARADGGKFWK